MILNKQMLARSTNDKSADVKALFNFITLSVLKIATRYKNHI